MWWKLTNVRVMMTFVVGGLLAVLCQAVLAQDEYWVPATSNPLFGGTTAAERAELVPLDPEGSGGDYNQWNDSVDATTPELIPVVGGTLLQINATANWCHYDGEYYGADGWIDTIMSARPEYDVWGSGLNNGVLGEVVGMFGPVDPENLPPRLDALTDDVTTPEIGQLFPVGLEGAVVVPLDADWLALGLNDEYEWNNNQGEAWIIITEEPGPPEVVYIVVPDDVPDGPWLWDASERTLFFEDDPPPVQIVIDGDGITVDGQGHTLIGPGDGLLVDFSETTGTKVKNLTAVDYEIVLVADNASDAEVSYVTTVGVEQALEFAYGDGMYMHHCSYWAPCDFAHSARVIVEQHNGWSKAGIMVRDTTEATVSDVTFHDLIDSAIVAEGVVDFLVDDVKIETSDPDVEVLKVSSASPYPDGAGPTIFRDIKADMQGGSFIVQGGDGPLSFCDFSDVKVGGHLDLVISVDEGQANEFVDFNLKKLLTEPRIFLGPGTSFNIIRDFSGEVVIEDLGEENEVSLD